MKLKRLLVALILTLLLGGLFGYAWYQSAYQKYLVTPVDPDSQARITFTVESGETVKNIGNRLEELELIPSNWAFYRYVKAKNLGPSIEAGKFVLKKSYTIPEIAEFLTKSRSAEVVVTIREGLTLEQVDRYLSQDQKLLPEGSFLSCAKTCPLLQNYSFLHSRPAGQSLEGYLFPDTYFVDPETVSPQEVISRMLQNFDQKLSSDLRSEIAKQGYSIHQIVTMASLVEKESRHPEERPIIAGILWKRLEEGMILGVDATVRFALNRWTGPLTVTDLNVNSPYNTRKKAGLPPGPISNFSLDALRAAIMPQASEYYYYLHDADGNIHFAKTSEEHSENKRKYL